MDRIVRAITLVAGLFLVVFGLWAFFGPQSFADQIATFPPYNRHLMHDLGAFQTGLGAVLLFALVRPDAVSAALGGAAVGTVLHVIAHVMDRDLGGRSTDPIGLGILAAAIVFAFVARSRTARR